jgi:glycosyltransferase involved in cell wall biosynthesis
MNLREPSHVVMVGTSFETRGGIAAVLRAYRAAGLFERWPVDAIATHRDGSRPAKLLVLASALAAFAGRLLQHPRAVLHVHSASRASFWRKSLFMALALAARWPVVFHLHGGGFATFHDSECGPLRRALVRFFLDRAACIVVVSESWRAWMRCATRNPNIVAIANPVTLPRVARGVRDAGRVAFAGRLGEGKGAFDLVEAVARLAERHPSLQVEFAGDGELAAVGDRARALGVADRVALRGWLAPAQRDAMLARASLFVLPSRAEGLPLALLEAMASGCAVVAASVGGIPDVVDHGYNGLLVPPGDVDALARAIDRLVSNPALAGEMGRAARATIAARFAPGRGIARLEDLYAGLGVPRQSAAAPAALQELS